MRVNTVRELDGIDPTEIIGLEQVCAAMPPTSEVARAVRDLLDGLRWTYGTRGARLIVTVDRQGPAAGAVQHESHDLSSVNV